VVDTPPLERFRNPAYTGKNRCLPCTAINVAIALVASGLLAAIAVELAVAAGVVSLLAIYLRGYLVPGTPALTEQYLPARVLAWFGHHDDPEPQWETLERIEERERNAVDPDRFLPEVGAVESDGESHHLTETVADRAKRHTERLRTSPIEETALADLLGTDPDDIRRKESDHPAIKVDSRVRTWPSEAALRADIALHRALHEQTDRWAAVPLDQRLSMLEGLRSAADACPACGADLDWSEGTVDSCCGTVAVHALVCRGCGDHLLERAPELGDTLGG